MGGGARRYGWSGFTNTGEYLKSLPSTGKLFVKRAGYVRDGESQAADKAAAGTEMSKVRTAAIDAWCLVVAFDPADVGLQLAHQLRLLLAHSCIG